MTIANFVPLAVTAGEPAGVGFDIILKSIPELRDCIVFGDRNALSQRAQLLNIPVEFCNDQPSTNKQLRLFHTPTKSPVHCGQLNIDNAPYVLACLDQALQGAIRGEFSAIVTAPLHKGIINDAGIPFTGHTEYLAEQTNTEVVMLLVADKLRVALATTHLPLAKVPTAINQNLLIKKLSILFTELQNKFGVNRPRIAVCGLNPHAGEQGHLGDEEIKIIQPAITHLQKSNMDITGPFPADTLFTPKHLQSVDAVFAMYHDQGLPVLKHAGFGTAVNTTLGLPIIRTSVDHGTALDLAGTGLSDAGSFIAAIRLAREQVASHNRPQMN